MAFVHPAVTAALAAPFYRRETPPVIWLWGAFLTALPDIDFIGFRLGIPYPHPFGHRGFTHSLLFAAVVALLSASWLRRRWPGGFGSLALFFFLCTASHGILDGMTNGGLGVAYFFPLDNDRYFLPWRPIPVAPLSPRLIFSAWGWQVLKHEMIYIWIPTAFATALILAVRWRSVLGRGSDSVR